MPTRAEHAGVKACCCRVYRSGPATASYALARLVVLQAVGVRFTEITFGAFGPLSVAARTRGWRERHPVPDVSTRVAFGASVMPKS